MRILLLLPMAAAMAFAQSPFTGPVTVEKIAMGFQFTEGPCWRSDGTLLFSDLNADTVYQWSATAGEKAFVKPSGGSNGLALDAQSRLLMAQQVQRQVARREADGSLTVLATHYNGKRLNSPNDLAVKSDGSIWFTDPNYGVTPAQEELGFYGVYRVTGDPKAPELMVSDLKKPNGIIFSPDESKLYVADTNDARVMAYDVNAGGLSNGRVFVQKAGDLSPDGIEVDSAGNLYIAGSDGKVWVASPAGVLLGSVAVPEKTRNLAWGDSDGKSLYIASGTSIYRVRAASSQWTMVRLPGTGQSGSYTSTFGQDSDYALNPPSFAVNGDGYVADLVTGLMWQQSDSAEMIWEGAALYCRALALGGFSDWRLPFAHELFSILNHGASNPALDTRVFTKSSAEYWWSADRRADDAARIWVTNAGGGIGPHPKNETVSAGGSKRMQVRCVRSPIQADSLRGSFTDNGDGTVTDNHTGLMWQKADSGTSLNWEDALGYAEGLSLAGYGDWRLPNIKELQSINEERLTNPSLDRTFFGGTLPAENWSSTTLLNQTNQAWTLDYTFGIASYRPKTEALRVRAVRGGFTELTVVSAASFAVGAPLAPASLASAFSSAPLPLNAAMTMSDGAGVLHDIPLLALTAGQANFVVPAKAATGIASVTLGTSGRPLAAGVLVLERVAPGLFAANADGKGVAAAVALTVDSDGRQFTQVIFDQNMPAGSRRGLPIDVSRAGAQVYLLLFGTGMRNATQKAAATVGGVTVAVAGPAAQGQFEGLDQANLGPLPVSLAGRGDVEIVLTVDGKAANRVTVTIK